MIFKQLTAFRLLILILEFKTNKTVKDQNQKAIVRHSLRPTFGKAGPDGLIYQQQNGKHRIIVNILRIQFIKKKKTNHGIV